MVNAVVFRPKRAGRTRHTHDIRGGCSCIRLNRVSLLQSSNPIGGLVVPRRRCALPWAITFRPCRPLRNEIGLIRQSLTYRRRIVETCGRRFRRGQETCAEQETPRCTRPLNAGSDFQTESNPQEFGRRTSCTPKEFRLIALGCRTWRLPRVARSHSTLP